MHEDLRYPRLPLRSAVLARLIFEGTVSLPLSQRARVLIGLNISGERGGREGRGRRREVRVSERV